MTLRSRWLGIVALVLIPTSGSSLGLGDINLNSYLNERLDAEIKISAAGAEELDTLQVQVASRDVFERFGVERVAILDQLTFTVERQAGGAIVRVRSSQPVVEPFLTFLIEARSSGGRLLREYTVLLDPPLYLPEPESPEPAPAAPIAPVPSAGVVSRPSTPPPATRPAQRPTASTYGPVRRNETLWGIAERVRPDSSISVNQAMIALYEANPDAFNGNINRLRAGATLRVPDYSEMTLRNNAQASAEVRRQNSDWRSDKAQAPSALPPAARAEETRLELVPPAPEPAAGSAPGAAADSAAPVEYRAEQEALNEELLAAVQSLRRELEETRQLIGLKDEEIAALQDRLSGLEQGREQPATGEVSGQEAAEPGAVEPGTAPAESVPAEPTVAQAPAASEPAAPEAATPPVAQLGSQEDEKGGLFSSLWTWLVIIVAILGGVAFVWRRRQEESEVPYESWASATAAGGAAEAAVAKTIAPASGIQVDEVEEVDETGNLELAEPEPESEAAPDIDVEPKPPAEPTEPSPPSATGEYAYPFEDTIAGATGINLEQSDPLAEADFHMAYGLYDQAADLVGKAIERDPDRSDLRLKLLDILFVWGKQEEFLSEAKDLRSRLDGGDSSEWERVAIMGRQICPDESIFATEGDAGALETAEGDEASAAETSGDESDVDFAIGPEAADSDSGSLDFDLSATGEVPVVPEAEVGGPDATAELEIEDLGLDIDLDELSGEHLAEPGLQEAAEAEALDLSGVEEAVEDVSATEALDKPGSEEPPEETGLTEVLDRVEEAADDETAVASAEDLDLISLDAEGETKELPALDMITGDEETVEVAPLSEEDLNLEDLTAEAESDLDKTAEIPIAGQGPDGETLIEEIFGDDEATKVASPEEVLPDISDADATQEMPQVKPSDVTLSEVGTKLDLARAYIDMGDPDGAKSILEEVAEEGDEAQKEEARQLLDGLG
ncbi:MAG: hypothetical protein JSW21_09935 [Gammaproteobacteria bacterium]|nr:MAG: hypothetical protein JSW21_09935 [Gammaproteobacteria bacterium]